MLTTSLVLSIAVLAGSPNATPVSTESSEAEPAFEITPLVIDTTLSLGMVPMQDEPETQPKATAPARFGQEGSRRWHLRGAFASEVGDSSTTFALVGVGMSQFIADNLSLDAELNAISFNQDIEDTEGINFNLLLRYHFYVDRNWTAYVDGGAGLMYSINDVPAHGSSFNFTPQAGVGFTLDLGGNIRLMTGVRWHHISNANTYSANPGRDSIETYLGLSFPF